MSNKNMTIAELARVEELEVSGPSDNPRRRMFLATCADGSVCELMTGWPFRPGFEDTIHCSVHASMNECEGAYRVAAVISHERRLREEREYKMTLLGLTIGAKWNDGSLALDDEKLNPKLDERAIRVMR